MVVIYTGDIERRQTSGEYDLGAGCVRDSLPILLN